MAASAQKHELPMEYGMWVMSVSDFLSMETLVPHQNLKTDGKLFEYTPGRPCFFLSHQWLSFKHPDPLQEQVKTFQELLRNLAKGNMEVPLAFMHKCNFDVVPTLKGDHWTNVLPNAVVWMDYFSMPQPNESDAKAVGADSSKLCTDLAKAVRSIPAYVRPGFPYL